MWTAAQNARASRPAGVPAALKSGIEECSDNLLGEPDTHHPFAEGEDVGVVVLAAVAGRRQVVTEGGTDAGHLVGEKGIPSLLGNAGYRIRRL